MSEIKPKLTRKQKAAPEATNDLVAPMRWMMLAQKSGSASWMSHCQIGNGWAMAFDGAVAAGHRVAVDWFACPQTERFLAALERSTAGVSLVVDEKAITVKSGRLTVRAPCLDTLPLIEHPGVSALPRGGEPQGLLDAIRKVLPLCKEGAVTVLESSIEIANGCATATNRIALLQAWHGVDLPRMILPRAAAAILLKQDGLTGIDASADKATFWFGPDKWLRFNLYDENAYPNINKVFDVQDNPQPLPKDFKEGVEALAPHVSEDGLICLGDFMDVGGGAARFDVAIGRENTAIKAEMLKLMASVATSADFDAAGRVIFYGDNIRGALSHAVR